MVDTNAQIGVGVIESLTKGLYDGNLNFLRDLENHTFNHVSPNSENMPR